jgi:hypothetical protein
MEAHVIEAQNVSRLLIVAEEEHHFRGALHLTI